MYSEGAVNTSCDRFLTFSLGGLSCILEPLHSTMLMSQRLASTLAARTRPHFPGLAPPGMTVPPVFADGASGSQVHDRVIEACSSQLRHGFANIGGAYGTSEQAGRAVDGARAAMANIFHCSPVEVVFGPSMTALTFHVARAAEQSIALGCGDEVVLDPLSHAANIAPWQWLANQRGATVKWLPVAGSGGECGLATDDRLASVLTPGRTKLVAVGAASNGTGTVHDVATICAAARSAGALTFVDAVHYAAHHLIDVQRWDCDFAVCSPYKFFGPHSGVLYGRRSLLESWQVHQLDCATDELPCASNGGMSRWELGTQNHEALAGVTAAVDYLAWLGEAASLGDSNASPQDRSRRERLVAGFGAIEAHEDELKAAFLTGVRAMQRQGVDLEVLGVSEPCRPRSRTPTFAIAKRSRSPEDLAGALCAAGIWTTSGNHYASLWSEHSGGLATAEAGLARLGFLHYNTCDEIERVLQVLRSC